MPAAFATPSTNDAAYAGPAPANSGGGLQLRKLNCPIKFDEPLTRRPITWPQSAGRE